jgi:hypothetical protein
MFLIRTSVKCRNMQNSSRLLPDLSCCGSWVWVAVSNRMKPSATIKELQLALHNSVGSCCHLDRGRQAVYVNCQTQGIRQEQSVCLRCCPLLAPFPFYFLIFPFISNICLPVKLYCSIMLHISYFHLFTVSHANLCTPFSWWTPWDCRTLYSGVC